MGKRSLETWTFKTYELLWRLLAARRTVILPPPAPAQDVNAPIFVIGCPRSGTTLLRVMLDSHPNIACPAETFFLLDLAQMWKSEDARRGLQEMGYDAEHVRRKLREFAAYFLQGYADSRGKRRVAEKTPHHVACLDFIEELFVPDSQYVMLYRHPFDVVSSMVQHFSIGWHALLRRYLDEEDNPYLGYARFWADHVAKMLEFEKAHADRCIRVRYEDLVLESEDVLRRMFAFLKEPWSEDVLKYYEKQHDLGRGDRKALIQKGVKPSLDNWHDLDLDLLRQMQEIVAEPAQALGYVDFSPPARAGQPSATVSAG